MSTWTLKENSTGDMEVTIEGETWKNEVKKAFQKLSKTVSLSGFRKGHVPANMLEKHISHQERWAEAINDKCNDWMRDAFEELNLSPISQPTLDVKEVNDEKAVLVYTFQVMPEVKLGDYKSLQYSVEEVSVSDEELDEELNRMRKQYADNEVVEGAAQDGDTVKIDYEGFKDGVAFEGGKAEGYSLKLGSGSFIPGFEDALVGCKAGDEKDIDLTFPEDYHEESLKGAPVVFKVKVNEVTREVLPELDDDFAQDTNIPNVETVEDLKKTVRERLENNKKQAAENAADEKLSKEFADQTEIEIPEVLIENEVQGMINQIASQIQQYGMSISQYLKMMDKTVDSLKEDYREQAHLSVKLRLALEELAKQENLEVSEDDIEEQFHEMATQYNMEIEDIKKYISADMIKDDLKNQKAFDFLKKNASETAA